VLYSLRGPGSLYTSGRDFIEPRTRRQSLSYMIPWALFTSLPLTCNCFRQETAWATNV